MVERHDYVTARRYLAPPRNSFWRWLDEGLAIGWSNGRTISFRPELEPILQRLAPAGLPPLGSLLLLIAATRDHWTESAVDLRSLVDRVINKHPGEPAVWLPEIFAGLDAVSQLDRELRSSSEARCELAELVFAGGRQRSTPGEAIVVLRMLAFGTPEMLLPRDPPSIAVEELRRDLFALREGLRRVDARALALRRRTGLDQLPEAAALELPPGERTRQLLALLESDEELSGLARLARNLMAAVYLPRAMSDRDDLPLGGVSDISNRGTLDRLLLSELAHDDLTLATRIAVNEAMYLRREAPPRSPPRRRAILLDAGLRTWGVPRVFATAVALALAANADRATAVDAWRARGAALEPVSLSDKAGLIEHLEALDISAHPGAALAAFAGAIEAHDEAADAVLITHEDAAADPQFQTLLAASPLRSLHVATINRQGEFRLSLHSGRGSRLLRTARLSLDELLSPRAKPVVSLIDASVPVGLPALLAVKPFPLLMPRLIDPQRACHVPGQGVLQVTRDRRLLWWQRPDEGGRQLADDLPSHDIEWLPPLGGFAPVLGVLRSRVPMLLEVDTAAPSYRLLPLDLDEGIYYDFAFHGGALLAIASKSTPLIVMALETVTGRRLTTLTLPPTTRSIQGRFFQTSDASWSAVAFDGIAIRVDPTGLPAVARVFESSGQEGAIGVTTGGNTVHSDLGFRTHVSHGIRGPARVLAVSRDGSRVVLAPHSQAGGQPHEMWLVETATGEAKSVQGDPHRLVEPGIGQYARPLDVQHRFHKIYAHVLGLVLVSRRGHHWLIHLSLPSGLLTMGKLHTDRPVRPEDPGFEDIDGPPDVGYKLRKATFPDGSRAVLDSRGLLHLQSSNPLIPEISLALVHGELGGWCASGGLWGRRYFTAAAGTMSGSDAFEKAVRPFVERLRR